MENFGEYIKRLRLEKGLNQTELAAKIKLDSGGLSKVENGKKQLNEERLELLSKALGVSKSEIKKQYLSDLFAKEIIQYGVSNEVFKLAEAKAKYFKNKYVKQGKLSI